MASPLRCWATEVGICFEVDQGDGEGGAEIVDDVGPGGDGQAVDRGTVGGGPGVRPGRVGAHEIGAQQDGERERSVVTTKQRECDERH